MSEKRSVRTIPATRRLEDVVERKSRVLFIRNIPFATKEEVVKELFSKLGEIKKFFAKIEDRGIAFVTYYDIRDAEKAHTEMNHHVIDSREIQVHYSLPKESELNLHETLENHANLYVLMKNCETFPTKEQFKEHFEKCGEVAEVREMESKPNVKFVEFYDSRHAKKAIETCHNEEWEGGLLEVKYASFSKNDIDRIEKTQQQLDDMRRNQGKERMREYNNRRNNTNDERKRDYHDDRRDRDRRYPSYPPSFPPQYMNGYPPYPPQYHQGYMNNYPPQYFMPYPPMQQNNPPQNNQNGQNQQRKDAIPQQYPPQFRPNQYYPPPYAQNQPSQQNNQQQQNRVNQPPQNIPPANPQQQRHQQSFDFNRSPQRQFDGRQQPSQNDVYHQQNPYH